MSRMAGVAVLVLFLACEWAAGSEQNLAPAQGRCGNFLFMMPQDWTRKDVSGAALLMPPQLPEGKWFELRLMSVEDPPGTPEQAVDRHVALIKQRYKVVQATPVQGSRNRDGRNAASIAMSVNVAEAGATKPDLRFWVIYAAKPDDRVDVMYYVANDFEVFSSHLKTAERFIDNLKFANMIVLAEGKPNLTELLVNETTDFLEWLIDVPLMDDQRQVIREGLVDVWKKKNQQEIDATLQLVSLRRQVAALEPAKADFARAKVQPEVIAGLRKEPSAVGKMLVQVYDAGHKPIAEGQPPLTRQSADAMLELIYFMAGNLENASAIAPTQDEKNQWAGKLAEQYAKMPQQQKDGIAQAPMLCAALRWSWPTLSEAEKQKLKDQFAAFEPIKQVRKSIADARKAKDESFAAAMQRLQRSHESYMMLSNMSYQMHQTNMAIIRNIGGNTTYRYEYRYR